MKSLFVSAAALLVSVSAFAMPKIGDQALFNLEYTEQGAVTAGTIENSITAFDAATNKYTVHSIVTMNKQSQTQDEATDQLMDDASIKYILDNCAAQNGKMESVTVPAGTFDTCALPLSPEEGRSGTVWAAVGVSFGIVKFDETKADGTHTVLQLQSFRLGQ
jgi:hypothetical protein